MDVLPACVTMHHVCAVPTEESVRSSGLELQIVVSYDEGAENWIQTLWKSSQCSQLSSHLSRPLVCLLISKRSRSPRFPVTCIKYHRLDGLNNRTLFLVVAESKKFKIKFLGEGSLGLAGAHSLLDLHMADSGRHKGEGTGKRPLASHLEEAIFSISSSPNYSPDLSLCFMNLGVRVSTCAVLGTEFSPSTQPSCPLRYSAREHGLFDENEDLASFAPGVCVMTDMTNIYLLDKTVFLPYSSWCVRSLGFLRWISFNLCGTWGKFGLVILHMA